MYTNHGNISLPLAVWLASDDYDLDPAPNVISATTLLKPLRSVILSLRIVENQIKSSVDISDLIASRLGTAVHTAVEVAWEKYETAMLKLGIPQKIIDTVCINPEVPDPTNINIFIEQRNTKEIMGFTISGKYDFVEEGRVKDIKTTGTYNWINGGNDSKYVMQGSIYRWLDPDTITDDLMDIEFIFTDWSPIKAQADNNYPQKRAITRTLPLYSIEDTQAFITKKLTQIINKHDLPQQDLPRCTPEELWQKPTKYAYYKNPTSLGRATKLFDNIHDANQRNAQDGSKGKIITRKGEVKFCRYCPARPICSQAEEYIEQGLVQL